jgi:sugar-specific transcriptional regulator TrmB
LIQSYEKEEGEVKVLMNLGCSLSQARVYLAMIQIGTASIASISKASGIHRENLYEIITSMIEKGLVEKEAGVPAKYRIVPPEEALPVLVTRKLTQFSQLETEVQRIIENFKKSRHSEVYSNDVSSKFMVITGKDLIIKRLHKALENSKVSVDTVTTQNRFSQAIVEFSEGYERALKRGVKIRLATEKHTPAKSASEILCRLTKNPNFQVRYFSGHSTAIGAVFDGNHGHISLSATANLSGAEGLWSNNSCLIAITQAYFEQQWANSMLLNFP